MWNSFQIRDRVLKAASLGDLRKQPLEQLPELVAKSAQSDQFEALWSLTVLPLDADISRLAKEYAGRLLHSLNPKCRLTAGDAVRAVLPYYEQSVEQVPWYLERQFGRSVLLAELDAIDVSDDLTASERKSLHTIQYWLRQPSNQENGGCK